MRAWGHNEDKLIIVNVAPCRVLWQCGVAATFVTAIRMRVGLSQPLCRKRLQTGVCCFFSKGLRWWTIHSKGSDELSGNHTGDQLKAFLQCVNLKLARWTERKYKRFRRKPNDAYKWLVRVASKNPTLFYYWQYGVKPNRLKPFGWEEPYEGRLSRIVLEEVWAEMPRPTRPRDLYITVLERMLTIYASLMPISKDLHSPNLRESPLPGHQLKGNGLINP